MQLHKLMMFQLNKVFKRVNENFLEESINNTTTEKKIITTLK